MTSYQRMNKPERRVWLAALAARLVVFGLLLWFFGERGLTMLGDSGQYLRLGRGLIDTGTFMDPNLPGLLEGTRPPAYPAYLAFFLYAGIPLWAASLFQLIAASFIPLIAMRLAGKLGFSEKTRFLAGLFTGLEPLQVLYSVTLISDAFGALLFLVGVCCLVSFWDSRKIVYLIVSALVLGAANYVRPVGLFLFLLAPAFIVLAGVVLRKAEWKSHLKYAFIFGLAFYLVLVPWMARNYANFGAFHFLSANSRHLYDYSAAAVRAAAEGTSFEEMRQIMRKEIKPLLSEPRDIRQFANQEILREKAVKIIRQHPKEYFKLYFFSLQTFLISGNYHYLAAFYGLIDRPSAGNKSFTILFSSRSPGESLAAAKEFLKEPYGLIALLGRVVWGAIFLLSLIGAAVLWRRLPAARFAVLLYVFFLGYLGLITLSLVTGIEARHRLFLNPLYFIFASYAIMDVFRRGVYKHPAMQ